jgi:hypothetical protein
MTRSERRPQLEALRRQFLSTMAEPAELRRLIEANPEILGDDFDTLMVQFVASLRHQGEAEQAQLVEQYRWLLAESRRLGAAAPSWRRTRIPSWAVSCGRRARTRSSPTFARTRSWTT